ncbi:MAG: ribonuclease III [Chlorobi bacterium]|nr:ribonuclease III [Chlorobiota bacterium]
MNNVLSFFKKLKRNSKTSSIPNYELEKLNQLSKKLELNFNDSKLFVKALTHRSYLESSPVLEESNERLEFLGDAALGLVVAEILFKNFPNEDEGFLTKTRSHLVYKNELYNVAMRIGLLDFILYDKRFISYSEEGMKTISADCVEALIGAIYLDSGIDETKKFITKWIINPNLETGQYQVDNNFKGQLLEYTHQQKWSSPDYVLINAEGPDHDKIFQVEVMINGKSCGVGKGRNKKTAEQNAAKNALESFKS